MRNRNLPVWFLTFLIVVSSLFQATVVIGDVAIPSGTRQILNNEDFQRASIYRVRDLYMADGSGNTMRLRAGEMSSDSLSLTLPTADGTANQCIATDGAGALSFIDVLRPTATQTVTNKTLGSTNTITGATAASFTNTGTITLPTSTDTLVGRATTDTLTNKTLTAPVMSSPGITNFVEFANSSAPSGPAAGSLRLYSKSDNKLYTKDSSLIETQVGASGTGEINVIANPNDANSGWAASAAGITVGTTTLSSDLPLSGVSSTAIKITPVSGSDYVRYRWTMPEALKNRKLKVEWHQRPLSGYATGDLKVDVYKHSDTGTCTYSGGSYTRFALTTDASSVTSIPNQTGKFTTYYDADSADCYELRIVRVAGTTALNIVTAIVGPGIQPQGAVVSAPITFTPYFTNLTTSATSMFWRRVGTLMHITGDVTVSTVAGVGNVVRLAPPTGYTFDTSFGTGADFLLQGTVAGYDTSAAKTYIGFPTLESSTQIRITGGENRDYWYSAVPFTWAAGDRIAFDFMVPIAEWSGSGTVNVAKNDVEYASNSSTSAATDTTSFAYGPTGSLVPTITAAASNGTYDKYVQFPTPIQSTDKIEVEIQDGGSGAWIPLEHHPRYARMGRLSGGTKYYGITWVSVNSTTISMQFGIYGSSFPSTLGSTSDSYPITAGDRWRVRKISGGQPVGFGTVSETSSGLMPSTNTNLDNAAATRLGLKVYRYNTAYNGGNSITFSSTPAGFSHTKSAFIPYQTQDGTWMLRFQTDFSSNSVTTADFTISGVTWNANTACAALDKSAAFNATTSRAVSGGGQVAVRTGSGGTSWTASCEAELSSKPTWAY